MFQMLYMFNTKPNQSLINWSIQCLQISYANILIIFACINHHNTPTPFLPVLKVHVQKEATHTYLI